MKLSDIYITKDYILERVSEEEIFEHFLGEEVIPFSKVYASPLRDDDSPGCKFFYTDVGGVLKFHDLSYSKQYNCFQFVQELTGKNYPETLKLIKNVLIDGKKQEIIKVDREKLIKERKEKKKPFQIKKRNYTKSELSFWSIGDLEISQNLLEDDEIYCTETYWENGYVVDNCRFTFAYFDQGTPLQIYFPRNKGTNRRRFSLSEERYFGGLQYLDFSKEYVFIIPKRKCSFYAKLFGINNVYILIERYIEKDLINFLKRKFKYVIYLYDNDRHGKSAAWLYRKTFEVDVATVPEGKDLTECIIEIKKDGMLDLIQQYQEQFNIEKL